VLTNFQITYKLGFFKLIFYLFKTFLYFSNEYLQRFIKGVI